jgi:hypothetical protein
VSQWKLVETSLVAPAGEDTDRKRTLLNETLKEMGMEGWQFMLATTNSILCSFICTSEDELRHLHELYVSGEMKRSLEKIFSLLADETVDIDCLDWKEEDYTEELSIISQLNQPGKQSRCIYLSC